MLVPQSKSGSENVSRLRRQRGVGGRRRVVDAMNGCGATPGRGGAVAREAVGWVKLRAGGEGAGFRVVRGRCRCVGSQGSQSLDPLRRSNWRLVVRTLSPVRRARRMPNEPNASAVCHPAPKRSSRWLATAVSRRACSGRGPGYLPTLYKVKVANSNRRHRRPARRARTLGSLLADAPKLNASLLRQRNLPGDAGIRGPRRRLVSGWNEGGASRRQKTREEDVKGWELRRRVACGHKDATRATAPIYLTIKACTCCRAVRSFKSHLWRESTSRGICGDSATSFPRSPIGERPHYWGLEDGVQQRRPTPRAKRGGGGYVSPCVPITPLYSPTF